MQADKRLDELLPSSLLFGELPPAGSGLEVAVCSHEGISFSPFFEFFYPCNTVFDLAVGGLDGVDSTAALAIAALKLRLGRYAPLIDQQGRFFLRGAWREDLVTPIEIHRATQGELGSVVPFSYGRFDLDSCRFTLIDEGKATVLHYCQASGHITPLTSTASDETKPASEEVQPIEAPFGTGDWFIFSLSPNASSLTSEQALVNLLQHQGADHPQQMTSQLEQLLGAGGWLIVKVSQSTTLPSGRVKRTFRSDLSQLTLIRRFVAQALGRQAIEDPGLLNELQLVLTEVFTNISSHGYHDRPNEQIKVELTCRADGVVIEVADQGESFSPWLSQHPDFSGKSETGFGLYIIYELLDEVTYTKKRKEGGWNRLHLWKRFRERGGYMDISHQVKEGALVIKLEGETLDASGAQNFKQTVTERIEEFQNYQVVFDLSSLQFIDSSGLGAFLSILRYVNAHHGDLKLAAMSPPVKTMFQIVRMHRLFEVSNSVDESIRAFVKS